MRRIYGFVAALAMAGIGLVGFAPSANAGIGPCSPVKGPLLHVALTIQGVLPTTCIDL